MTHLQSNEFEGSGIVNFVRTLVKKSADQSIAIASILNILWPVPACVNSVKGLGKGGKDVCPIETFL